jgi:colanic acid/amylovoran biosynthesis glycosyltransferase
LPHPRLTLIPSVPVWADGDAFVFDRKFHDGLMQYMAAWPGRVRCLAWRGATALSGFGTVRAQAAELPFDIELLDEHETITPAHLEGATVVLAAADDHRQLHVAALCRERGIRCVYVIEYIPETRHQISRLEAPNAFVRWRRDLFLRGRERARRAAFRCCDGLQANGMPAHEAYQSHGNCLLYFDTRMGRRSLISDAALQSRLATLAQPRPLRLAFSGRLIAMKGADHLIDVAARLQARGVACEWTIYGAGELDAPLRAKVRRLGLAHTVQFPGAVDFDAELVPAIQSRCDVYVMLHRQSDPSCTYLETLSCGIPIVGYDNRALGGLLRVADIGTGVPMDDIDGVVDALTHLDGDRNAIARMSRAALTFARGHGFEDTFQRRVDQLIELATVAP